MEVESVKENSILRSFTIFNIIPPKKEGAKPKIYWYYSKEERTEEEKLNEVGLIITFAGFCRKFKPENECDYIFTNKQEIGIYRLYGDIFMSVSIESHAPFNRFLLQSILRHCKLMFSHFWVPLPDIILEGENPPSEEMIESQIDYAFQCIISSINWSHLDFSYIFNSFTRQQITGDFHALKRMCAQLLLRHRKIFSDICILDRKHRVIHSTFTATVTQALAFGMRKRFGHLFLHNPRADRDALTWIIGCYTDTNGINSLYQPVIYIGGVPHLLVAFKLHNYKIVLTLDPEITIDEKILREIPHHLRSIRDYLRNNTAVKPITEVPVPFALAMDDQQEMSFDCCQIDAKSRQAVDENFIRGHQAAMYTDTIASVGFPGVQEYFITVIRGARKAEKVVTCKSPSITLSEQLKICNRIIVLKEQNRILPTKSSCSIQ